MESPCTPLNDTPSSPPQLGQFYTGPLDGQLNELLITAIFTGTLIPISIAFILTSSHLWKQPVFILNACAISCGFAYGAVTLVNIVSNSIMAWKSIFVNTSDIVFCRKTPSMGAPGIHTGLKRWLAWPSSSRFAHRQYSSFE